jgi:OmpA-OmpF porin, OOP family
MFKKFTAALVALIAACSAFAATSGPTYNLSEIQTATGQRAFKVECYGLLESSNSCVAAAQSACGGQRVNPLQGVEGTKVVGPRELIFTCDTPQSAPAPVAPQPAPVAPAPAPAPAPRKVVLDEKTNFAFDKAELTPKARETLDRLAADANGVTFASVAVEGYTDAIGSANYNVALSERRAQTVLAYLKSRGVQSSSFSAHGFGKDNPVASNATSVGRAQNRRVEIVLTQ